MDNSEVKPSVTGISVKEEKLSIRFAIRLMMEKLERKDLRSFVVRSLFNPAKEN